jgi:Na+/H+-dicarboxylate symporter
MAKFPLHFQILVAITAGGLFGFFWPNQVGYVAWMGDVFMRALKMVIVPLVLASIVSGVANVGGADNLGRLGVKTLGYYLFTSLLAILTGLLFVNIIRPGLGVDLHLAQAVDGLDTAKNSFGDTLRNIVPTNVVEAMSRGEMLSIIFFSVLFGFFINKTSEESRGVLSKFFNAFFEVMMKLTFFIILFTPLGVFGILATTVADNAGRLGDLLGSLGWYSVTVLLGLLVHFFISLPAIMWLTVRANPLIHLRNMSTALFTAFSTSSSGATLSLTMDCVTRRSGVSNKVSSFTLPLGATINMDGTALYELVAAMFIAQAYGIEMSFLQQILMVITALLASIGAAAIPMAGLVMITVVLSAVGLPLEGVGLIIAVDRFLDMFRTATNVWSDACGAVIIAKSEGETTLV